jgi:Undecaprenyl-phosphate glucose phosphotransferase
MNTRFLRVIQVSVFGLDMITLNMTVMLAWMFIPPLKDVSSIQFAFFWMFLNVSWLIVSAAGAIYMDSSISSYEVFSRRTMHAYFYWVACVSVYLLFARDLELPRSYIALIFAAQILVLLLNRFLYLTVQTYLRKHEILRRKVLIVGYNEMAKKLASCLEADGQHIQVVGFCEEEKNVRELSIYPIMSPIDSAIEVSQRMGVDEIYSTILPEQHASVSRMMQTADKNCIRFRLVPDLSPYLQRNFHVQFINDIPVFSKLREPLDTANNIIKKRVFDILVSSFVCLFIFPWLIPLVALLIWIESPGPVFFRQLRTGRNNKPFWCIKFRSMKINREADMAQAVRNDKRLTRIGAILRKTSIDELPQFINVLKGEMSVVGPRPHMLKHTNDYSMLIDEYMVRHYAKPGITGWAQVNGYRGETRTLAQMQGRVRHDLWYIENWSLWLDVRIIFLTIYSIVRGDENAF